ncbi:hypothetical protein LTR08_006931 [Meristemomyces frigidus]|nr:hypothetical protein LTR08_006931 [Meristemomyces frigidus]
MAITTSVSKAYSAPTYGHQTPRRAPSLDLTLQPTFSSPYQVFFANGNQTTNSSQQHNDRSTRPPVPLFHSNFPGNLGNTANAQQFQQVTDFTNIEMGGGDINVAYDGTFGDLSAAGNATMFDLDEDLDYEALLGAADNRLTDFTATNGNTVSPRDVFNCDSIPPSTSFTNLTTPGLTYLETPADDYENSPLLTDNLGYDSHTGADNWFPLFPDNEIDAAIGTLSTAPSMSRTTSSSSNQILVHPGGEPTSRKRSSTVASPTFSPIMKLSSIAGVNARKRDKPLPPIMVNEDDAPALKRARNTAAARKSRAKKVAERDDLEAEISDLKAQVEFWKARALGVSDDSED